MFKKENELAQACLHVYAYLASLWMLALTFALLPMIELCGVTGKRPTVTLDPHTAPWLLSTLTGSSSDFYSMFERICSHIPVQRHVHHDTQAQRHFSLMHINPNTLIFLYSYSFLSLRHIHAHTMISGLHIHFHICLLVQYQLIKHYKKCQSSNMFPQHKDSS